MTRGEEKALTERPEHWVWDFGQTDDYYKGLCVFCIRDGPQSFEQCVKGHVTSVMRSPGGPVLYNGEGHSG